jgi:hypothetical protein
MKSWRASRTPEVQIISRKKSSTSGEKQIND